MITIIMLVTLWIFCGISLAKGDFNEQAGALFIGLFLTFLILLCRVFYYLGGNLK